MASTPPPSRFWSELTCSDFDSLDAADTVAVLPLGATEQHGPHLCLGVDQMLADSMLHAGLALLPPGARVLVLPTQAVGYSPEHARFRGTLTIPIEALIASWIAIGESVSRAGVRKLLLFNTHGGHIAPMDIVARELRSRADMIVYGCSWWNLPLGDAMAQFSAEEHRFGVHAGDIETSLMLAVSAEHVRMDMARDFQSSARTRAEACRVLGDGRAAKLGWHMQDYNSEGAAGNAAAATAAKGRVLLQATGRALADLLVELQALPLSTLDPRPPL